MKKKEKPNNIKIAEAILEQYKPTTVGEMQDALKETFGPMFEAMLKSKFPETVMVVLSLKSCYPFIFVDCMYVNTRRNYETQKCAIYTILGYDIDRWTVFLDSKSDVHHKCY